MKILAYARATHFGPTVLVTSVSFLLAHSQFSVGDSLVIAAAIFAGQCVVGWSNDLIDYPLDRSAVRSKKPLVAGELTARDMRIAIAWALAIATILSFAGPLGVKGGLVHALGVLSATIYNLKAKRTVLSFLPYLFSFGAMPWAIYLAAGKVPSIWLCLGFAIFASAFHFLNVLKDLEWDLQQGVNGLPQRLGRSGSLTVALTLISLGVALVIVKWNQL
jgi:4-hydroxybenzoate polyprenyltransferase